MNKKFIYFPSFSAGVQGNRARKNHYYLNDIPSRFWQDDFPYNPYKYFLLTAGHDYKKMNTRDEFGLNNGSLVIGDSGGYQIASGVIKWDISIRQQIFEWLEHNSDIAMNLDIPPRMKYEGKYEECLKISKDNFKYFYEKQTGKTKFLNVLQGNNLSKLKQWYNEVKGFEFNGWGMGGLNSSYLFFQAITLLIQNKEHLKNKDHFFHFLGTSTITNFIILSKFQSILNKLNTKTQIVTDSSTPNRATVFGNIYTGYNIKKLNFETCHLSRELINVLGNNLLIPNTSNYSKILIDKGYKLKDLCEFTAESYLTMTHNNLYVFLDAIEEINWLIEAPKYIQEQAFNKDVLYLCDVLEKIVTDENPEKIFLKNEMRIKQIANKLDLLDVEQQKITTNNSMFKIITE